MGARSPSMRDDGADPTTSREFGVVLIAAAIGFSAIAQGAFYPRAYAATIALFVVAALVSFRRSSLPTTVARVPMVASLALGTVFFVDGAIHGRPQSGIPAAALMLAFSCSVVVLWSATDESREWLLNAITGIAVGVAIIGWFGVATRHTPLALLSGSMWRAASTITYANGTGALVAIALIVTLGRTRRARSTVARLTVFVLTVGLLATVSRAAIASCALGILALAGLTRPRIVRGAAAPFIGAIVAFVALLPSMPDLNRPNIVLATFGVAVGVLIALSSWRVASVICVAAIVVTTAVPALRHDIAFAWHHVQESRVGADAVARSEHIRSAGRSSAIDAVRRAPFLGVGPQHYSWTVDFPVEHIETRIRYVHDEYLQIVAETGLVGAGTLLAGAGAVVLALWHTWKRTRTAVSASCLGVAVAVGAHGAVDFIWHIPVVSLTAGLVVAYALCDGTPADGLDASRLDAASSQ